MKSRFGRAAWWALIAHGVLVYLLACATFVEARTKPGLACGAERAAVKHVTDLKPGSVRDSLIASAANPTLTTVEALSSVQLAAPVRGSEPRGLKLDAANGSFAGVEEFHVYTVQGTIALIKKEADLDFHIVLIDGLNTMVVESVDPRCAVGSAFLPQITSARAAILAAVRAKTLTLTAAKRAKGLHVAVTGPVFFDKIHGQTGVASNGVEIHPILTFEVLP